MMKVVSSKQMAEIESYAYQKGYKEEEFMEAAGQGIAKKLNLYIKKHSLERKVTLICGTGNNGGDAYTAGLYLLKSGYQIIVYQYGTYESCSHLCQIRCNQLRDHGIFITFFDSAEKLQLPEEGIIVDALFGTGLNRILSEPFISIIKKVNTSSIPIVSIDIPSGLDGNSGSPLGAAIRADYTIFLGLPKVGFFLNVGRNYTGKLEYVDFGLPTFAIDSSPSHLNMFEISDLQNIFPDLVANRHKYQAGYVVGLAGSIGMSGAANLSSIASLRGGAGIVKLLYPNEMEGELSNSIYELVKIPYNASDYSFIIDHLNKASAIFIGPGIGTSIQTKNLLKQIFLNLSVPSVIDADGLNIISQENFSFPKNCIITPHLGELLRLLKIANKPIIDDAFICICQGFVEKNDIVMILKGGPSFIFSPHDPTVVIPFGDPGMATAGSGDVLTGLTAALLAQGLSCRNAAIAAVFLHAYSGECAAKIKTSYCMIASDIIDNFCHAFALIKNLKNLNNFL